MSRDFERSLPAGESRRAASWLNRIHLDPTLLILVLALCGCGLMVMSSVSGADMTLFYDQLGRVTLGLGILVLAAQAPPSIYLRWAVGFYLLGIFLLILVIFFGVKVKGSQRWLDVFGLFRFQPSELVKITVPMGLAWYLQNKQIPLRSKHVWISLILVIFPVSLIYFQPDLGTSILVAGAGLSVLFLAGISWRWILSASALVATTLPLFWAFAMTGNQKQRVITLLSGPETDPLGTGWNIMQSTTAIGSGGMLGKGLGKGTQSHLDFLPEAQTDFIIAVIAEEFGLIGVSFLLALYIAVLARALYLAVTSESTFVRLFGGALSMTFFFYFGVNIAMVSGLLPVVGVPLPLISYGGSSVVTLLFCFGMIMSMRFHKAW